jgi:hypothetical protein
MAFRCTDIATAVRAGRDLPSTEHLDAIVAQQPARHLDWRLDGLASA